MTDMRMKGLIIITKIKPGKEDALRTILREIKNDLEGNPYVNFYKDRMTHLARWVILNDSENGLRLLFASNFNGDTNHYIEELIRISPTMDEIWRKCEGYPGIEGFLEYAHQHSYKTQLPFFAFPDETVESIRFKIAFRNYIEEFIDYSNSVAKMDDLLTMLPKFTRKQSWLNKVDLAVAKAWRAFLSSIHQGILSVALWIAHKYGELDQAREFTVVADTCSDSERLRREIAHVNTLRDSEDDFEQNQFTLLAEIKPNRLSRLRIALFLGTFIARFGFPPGEIRGIFTIHSFHWVIIDNGKRLLFMSNYDGSAENYLGDFLDKLHWGLNIYYKNCVGYPEGGMAQVEAFTHWINEHQIAPEIYYSAYPQESVLNIIRDRRTFSALGDRFTPETAEQWLELL